MITIKKIKKILKESRSGEPEILSPSYTQMVTLAKRMRMKEARFIVTHEDKIRMGDAEEFIHYQIATNDPTKSWMYSHEDLDAIFSKSAKYAGYIDARNQTFSVAYISKGSMYNKVRNPSPKLKMIIDTLEKAGFHRDIDGRWPR